MEAALSSIPLWTFAVGAAAVIWLTWGVFALRSALARARRRRRWERASRAEQDGCRLLEQVGYVVLGSQVETTYTLLVDGRSTTVLLRADYLVSRDGWRYVAEVKSGRRAPLLETSATRRQLLEYLVAFDVRGVLLVDGETRRVHEVVFPTRAAAARDGWTLRRGWVAVAMLTAAAAGWAARSL
jgi:hypothetical protein